MVNVSVKERINVKKVKKVQKVKKIKKMKEVKKDKKKIKKDKVRELKLCSFDSICNQLYFFQKRQTF